MSDFDVVKYGGSVLKDASSFRAAAEYQMRRSRVALVSAPAGVTNQLMDIYDGKNQSLLPRLKDTYWKFVEDLPQRLGAQAMRELEKEVEHLSLYLDIGARDAFVGSGEGHAAIILSSHINALGGDSEFIRGPDAVFYLNGHGLPDMENGRESFGPVREKLESGKIVVVGGYLGRHNTTGQHKLGARNVNDAFAAALAGALDAVAVEIIKDVPGVYRVPPEFGNYGLLEQLSYDEARKMSWRGSPVVHPGAVRIGQNKKIPIIVKSMDSTGTLITADSLATAERPVAALVAEITTMITVLDDIMDSPEGRGYVAALNQFELENDTSIGMIASDVGSISYTISMGDKKRQKGDAEAMLEDHNKRLAAHLNSHGYKPVVRGQEVGVISVVGDGMQNRLGMLSTLSGMLTNSHISVRAAAQSDEKYAPPSITFVVDADKLERGVKALAKELFL
ncbi:MAG: aspartate kinase [Candidatus Aenigmarchaeota archaeon]|nr:aspartate kinase [Candidatus Aenigmarchaeota archaeon]